MIDKEKVIRGLECHKNTNCKICEFKIRIECPYFHAEDCRKTVFDDAISILKEQEAVVRCKDCRHWDAKKHECHNIHSYMQYRPCFQDWFCADGENGET